MNILDFSCVWRWSFVSQSNAVLHFVEHDTWYLSSSSSDELERVHVDGVHGRRCGRSLRSTLSQDLHINRQQLQVKVHFRQQYSVKESLYFNHQTVALKGRSGLDTVNRATLAFTVVDRRPRTERLYLRQQHQAEH